MAINDAYNEGYDAYCRPLACGPIVVPLLPCVRQ